MHPLRRIIRPGLLLPVVFILNACTTLGPDFQQPEVAWLEQWQDTLYGQAMSQHEGAEADLRFWWRLFDDPRLDQLIDAARTANPSLRVAGLRILQARAQLGIAGSNLYPQLQQIGGAVNYVNSRQSDGGDNQELVSWSTGFNLGWELDFWGRFRRGIESADAAFFNSIANQQDMQVLLVAQVAELYYGYRTTQLRIAIARDNAALQERSYEITQRLFKSGQQSELDLQQAKAQYMATLSTIPQLQLALTQTRNALAAQLGRPPGELPELDGEVQPLPSVAPVMIRDIPARLLMRRPDIRAAAWQVAAQSAQIGIAEADFYPSISLLGSLGWSGDTLSGTSNTGTLSLGSGLQWNVFDHGRIANNVRVQDARLQQLIEQYQDVVLQAAREIDDAAISVVKRAEQRAIVSESLAAARRALELANSQYREGYADFQRVLDSQQSVAAQSERELITQGSHISAIIGLYKALGGGWLETPVQDLVPASVRETMQQRTDWGDLLSAPLAPATLPPSSETESSQHESE